MIEAYTYPVPNNPAAVSFIDNLMPGQIFNTYDVIETIRGKRDVDIGSSAEESLNASIGRGLKFFQVELGIAERKSKEPIYINGRKTCCSEWWKM